MPLFLRRARALFRARSALVSGLPERALEVLREPCLALCESAVRLRVAACTALYRSALERAQAGRDQSLARILRLLAPEDPVGVQHFVQALGNTCCAKSSSGPGRSPPAAGRRSPGASVPDGDVGRGGGPGALLFHLLVDEGGEFLVASGERLVLGHQSSPGADLPFLADVASRHAELSCSESFHGGYRWRIVPIGGNPVLVEDEPVAREGRELEDGASIRLAGNLRFSFHAPETGSRSALLELEGGTECLGAFRVLLLGTGPAGGIRVGPRSRCLIPVAHLEDEIHMHMEAGELHVRCEAGLARPGEEERRALWRIPCPPPDRVELVLPAKSGSEPPFALSVGPIARPPRATLRESGRG